MGFHLSTPNFWRNVISSCHGILHKRPKILRRSRSHKFPSITTTTIPTTVHVSPETIPRAMPTTNSFWHDASMASLNTLLQKATYPEDQISYFLILWQHTLPYLTQGPDSTSPALKSKLSRDGTPYDMQWNLVESSTSASDSIIRVSFDTGSQPKAFILSLAKVGYLAPADSKTELLDSALATLSSITISSENTHAPWFASGIDMLRCGQLLYKIYLRPATSGARALSHERAHAIISTWDNDLFNGGLREAYSVIEKYNVGLEEEQMEKVHMLGWDCVDVAQTRVKVYTYHSHTSLHALKEMWTQRGQLTGEEIDIGLRCIEELYDLLFSPASVSASETESQAARDERESRELLSRLGKPQSICLGLEIKPGAKLPTPKLYLQPARFGSKSDQEIAVALQGWLGKRGFGEVCESYGEDFGEIFPHRNHTLEAGCHSFMSLAVKKGGKVAVTLYLQPMIYKTLQDRLSVIGGEGDVKGKHMECFSGLKAGVGGFDEAKRANYLCAS